MQNRSRPRPDESGSDACAGGVEDVWESVPAEGRAAKVRDGIVASWHRANAGVTAGSGHSVRMLAFRYRNLLPARGGRQSKTDELSARPSRGLSCAGRAGRAVLHVEDTPTAEAARLSEAGTQP